MLPNMVAKTKRHFRRHRDVTFFRARCYIVHDPSLRRSSGPYVRARHGRQSCFDPPFAAPRHPSEVKLGGEPGPLAFGLGRRYTNQKLCRRVLRQSLSATSRMHSFGRVAGVTHVEELVPSMPSRPPCQAGVGTTEALPANKDGTPDDDAHGEEFTADELTGLSLSSTRGGLNTILCAPALPILHANIMR